MTAPARFQRPVRARRPVLGTGWPIYALLLLYPVWWVLGLSVVAWFVFAVPAAVWLWSRPSISAPPGFGVWAVFVAWVLLSATQLARFDDLRSFAVRAAIYVAGGIYFLFVYNLPPGHSARIRNAIVFFFSFAIVAGLLAIVLPFSDFVTPFERVLPQSIGSIEFVRQLVHGQLAQVHVFLGFPVNRPAAPFAFTNEWGSAVGILAPFAVYGITRVRRGVARRAAIAIGVLGLIPIVYSLNRGLWLSLAAAAAYVAVRLAIHGRARPLINVVGAGLVLTVLVLTTPLGSLAANRLDAGHSDSRRVNLVGDSFRTTLESPILGHRGPVIDVEAPNRAPIGTHGQVYLLGVSHGIPGALLYAAALVVILVRSRRGGPASVAFWANASVFVALIQMAFYSHLPVQIQLVLILGAVAMRPPPDEHTPGVPIGRRTSIAGGKATR